jgi:hypothetical protein
MDDGALANIATIVTVIETDSLIALYPLMSIA